MAAAMATQHRCGFIDSSPRTSRTSLCPLLHLPSPYIPFLKNVKTENWQDNTQICIRRDKDHQQVTSIFQIKDPKGP